MDHQRQVALMADIYAKDYRSAPPATQERIAQKLRHAALCMRPGAGREAVLEAMRLLEIAPYPKVPRILPSLLGDRA